MQKFAFERDKKRTRTRQWFRQMQIFIAWNSKRKLLHEKCVSH